MQNNPRTWTNVIVASFISVLKEWPALQGDASGRILIAFPRSCWETKMCRLNFPVENFRRVFDPAKAEGQAK